MHPPAPTPDAEADLTPMQRETLRAVLGMLVPPSPDGRMPGAADLPQVLQRVEDVAGQEPAVRHGLDALEQEALARCGAAFAALDRTSRSTVFAEFRARHPGVMERLGLEAVTCYYQQDGVLQRLGLEARPPYPLGHQVIAGDLTLLRPVIARGKIYRDVS